MANKLSIWLHFHILIQTMSRTTTGRASAYGSIEVDALLDIVDDILPIGGDMWERVGNEFRARYGIIYMI